MTPIIGKKDWTLTYSGVKFYALDARPEMIRVIDIAHHLSFLCRFGGACRKFYSVAQHSILVSSILPNSYKLCGLMHDAAEAYIGDMVRPVKRYLPDYSDIERHIWECAIAPAFGLHSQIPEIVRAADNVALVTERRDLMIPHPDDWSVNAEPLSERIQPWSSDWSDRAFLEAFAKYTNS